MSDFGSEVDHQDAPLALNYANINTNRTARHRTVSSEYIASIVNKSLRRSRFYSEAESVVMSDLGMSSRDSLDQLLYHEPSYDSVFLSPGSVSVSARKTIGVSVNVCAVTHVPSMEMMVGIEDLMDRPISPQVSPVEITHHKINSAI
jgi:hypothetical protein